jgi:predicted MFS family arabinose efflux permease
MEGLRVGLGHPVLRALVGTESTSAFFGNFFGTLYSLYAIRELGLGAAALGVTITFGGIGDLAGAFLASVLSRRWRLGNILIGSLVIKSGAAMLIPIAGGPPWMAMLLLMMAQLFGDGARTIYDIHAVSLRQTITPDRLLGRVNASLQFIIAGLGPIGAILGGILAETLGIRTTLAIAVLGGLGATAWLFFSPIRKMVELPPPIGTPTFDSTADNA